MNVAVVGLGYVGLPLAVALARRHDVVGFDISSRRVAALREGVDATNEIGFVGTVDGAARLRRRMVERVLTRCEADPDVSEPLLILLRRFATESAREEARVFCDQLVADVIDIAPEDRRIAA